MLLMSQVCSRQKKRADRIVEKMPRYAKAAFPLLDLKWNRDDCLDFLKARVPHQTPRSACVYCPYRDAEEWLKIKQNVNDWARAVEVDNALRSSDGPAAKGYDKALYVHRSAIPLEMVDLEAEAKKERERKRRPLFEMFECGSGMCGV